MGQSQGAAAVFATAGYSADYAPDVAVRGVVATGIPFFSPEGLAALAETRPRDEVDHMLGYNFLALTLVEWTSSGFVLADYLSEAALETVGDFDTRCYQEMKSVIVDRGLTYDRSFRKSPTKPLEIAFAQMGYPTLALPVPAYIGSGERDRDTPLRMQAELVRRSCRAGTVIESHVYPGLDHRSVLARSADDSIPFVEAVFAGKAIEGNCDALPFGALSE